MNNKARVAVALGVLALGAGFEACSSSSSGPAGFGSAGNTGGGATEAGVQTTCTNPTLNIVFTPMYSAYVPGSTEHTFQIPAILDDESMATWSVSDPSKAQLSPQSFDGAPGVMITVQGQGSIQVVATESGGACGTSTLNVTAATEDDWQTGSARYNNGVSLHFGGPRPDGGDMRPEGGGGGFDDDSGCGFFERDGGTACTNCHGPSAMSAFNDVSHTPEQTGGFSDEELIDIIVNGNVPDGGYFDPSVVIAGCDGGSCAEHAYSIWHRFHQWCDITPDQYTGIVAYLRSLTPAPQMGTSNFGGHHHHDGGMMPPFDGSSGPPPASDGAAPTGDAAGE